MTVEQCELSEEVNSLCKPSFRLKSRKRGVVTNDRRGGRDKNSFGEVAIAAINVAFLNLWKVII